MNREEFNELLKKAELNKKEFCDLIGLNYPTVNTWRSSNINIPIWVKSWLENYIKAKDINKIAYSFNDIFKTIKPYIEKDKS